MVLELTQGLNTPQQEAVIADRGPLLILAGPGSGKTRVLTRRVAYLIQEMQVEPWQIMAVTFTNKAASEMRHRVEKFLGNNLRGLRIGTFHATCARLLRIHHEYTPFAGDFVIYDREDQLKVVEQALNELNLSSKQYTPAGVLRAISKAKNELILPDAFESTDSNSEVARRVYARYQHILRDSDALDFDDLLLEMVLVLRQQDALRQFIQKRYEFILVDEFQDTNMTQYELVKLMGAPQNNIFAVGDEDQSIYAFRGADYRNVRRFQTDFPDARLILLEQNYRSTRVVLDVAQAVIDRNHNRTPKSLFTEREGGDLIRIYEAMDQEDEAEYIIGQIKRLVQEKGYTYRDFAIMYRTNVQSRALEAACIDYGLPYQLIGGVGFYKRMEIRDILAYLRLIHNPNDSIAFSRIVNVPRRGIGKKTLQSFIQYAASSKLTYSQVLDQLRTGQPTTLSKRATRVFADFAHLLQRWQQVAEHDDLATLFDTVLQDVDYMMHLKAYSDDSEEFLDRQENVQELRGLVIKAVDEGLSPADFLAEQTLMSDITDQEVTGRDAVSLMTLHAAKGLEFPVVFITGIEHKLLPHVRSLEFTGVDHHYDPQSEGVSEERRLFYVGITRAKDYLYLTYALSRMVYGQPRMQEISPFLQDIPEESVESMPDSLVSSIKKTKYRSRTRWQQDDSDDSRLQTDWNAFQKAIQRQSTSPPDPDSPAGKIRSKIIAFPGSSSRSLQFSQGDRVRHSQYGEGTVQHSRLDGHTEIVTIKFDHQEDLHSIFADNDSIEKLE